MPKRRRGFDSVVRSRAALEREIAAEVAFHLEMATRDLMNQGMNESDARAEAARRFGDQDRVDAECRRLGRERDRKRSRIELIDEIRQDTTFALRQLARARGFATVAISTLGLGIGVTACVFSVLRAVVLAPLPYTDAQRVVLVNPTNRSGVVAVSSGAEFKTMRSMVRVFEGVAARITDVGYTYVNGSEPVVVNGGRATANYFEVLGVKAALGRAFAPQEDQPGAAPVVVLTHRMWVRQFAGDSSILGREIRLDNVVYRVIGVLPASFDVRRGDDDFWVPLTITTADMSDISQRAYDLVARLRPGLTIEAAAAAAGDAEREIVHRFDPKATSVGIRLLPISDALLGDSRQRLFLLLGAVGLVLVIACVNVANLLLARGVTRATEFAIRAALGAARGRLMRQLFLETIVLALSGALVGVALCAPLIKGFVAVAPDGVPRLDQVRLDGGVLLFTLSIAVVSSILVGLVPTSRSTGATGQLALREAGRAPTAGGRRTRMRSVLVTAEVALAMNLLTGAGLLIRTAWHVQHVDAGFAPDNLFFGRLILPGNRYPDSSSIVPIYRELARAVSETPSVSGAALTSLAPLSSSGSMQTAVAVPGSGVADQDRPRADFRLVSPGFFATLGLPLVAGRDIAWTDDASSPHVAVISKALAAQLWPGERVVIGKQVAGVMDKQRIDIIGVVADLHDESLVTPPQPTMYLPYQQTPGELWPALQRSMVIVARTQQSPRTMMRPIHAAVMRVDNSLPFADQHTMDEYLHNSVATAQFNTMVLAALGGLALLLASIGIYGVVAYFVTQRTPEIGVRIALGAQRGDIWRLVFGRGLLPIAIGVVLGVILSLITARLLRRQLFGVATTDPATLISVTVLLAAVALVATFVPARRAMRVAPSVALRGT